MYSTETPVAAMRRRISACSADVRSGYSMPPGAAGAVRSPTDANPAAAARSIRSAGRTSSSLRCAMDSGIVAGGVGTGLLQPRRQGGEKGFAQGAGPTPAGGGTAPSAPVLLIYVFFDIDDGFTAR